MTAKYKPQTHCRKCGDSASNYPNPQAFGAHVRYCDGKKAVAKVNGKVANTNYAYLTVTRGNRTVTGIDTGDFFLAISPGNNVVRFKSYQDALNSNYAEVSEQFSLQR